MSLMTVGDEVIQWLDAKGPKIKYEFSYTSF